MLTFKRIDSEEKTVGVWFNKSTTPEPHVVMVMKGNKAVLKFRKNNVVPNDMLNKLNIAAAAFETACNRIVDGVAL